MENTPEQRIVPGTATVPPEPAVVQGQFYVSTPADPPRPGLLTMIARTLRLLLRRLIYNLIVLTRPLRPHAGVVAIVVVLLGVIGWLAAQVFMPSVGNVRDTRVALLPPSTSVEEFIEGQRTYNADLMWSALSSDAQAARLQQGASKDAMQSMANNQQRQGLRYTRYDYVGGVQLENGGSMYFYAVDLELQERRGKLPMTIVADPDGKVVQIISPLNE